MKRSGLLILCSLAACGPDAEPDVGLEGLALTALEPRVVVTGTTLAISGDSFVDGAWGESTLELTGVADGRVIELAIPSEFVDYDHLTARVDAGVVAAFGATEGLVPFRGEAVLSVVSAVDGETYRTEPLPIEIDVAAQLTPEVTAVQTGGLLFVNDDVLVTGGSFLLGGDEGQTVATVTGCFQPVASPLCVAVDPETVALTPAEPFSRDEGHFRFSPAIAGIREGQFRGEVVIENRHASGTGLATRATAVTYDLIGAQIFQVAPSVASLGQYVSIEGGGFVGGEPNASTEVQLVATFVPTGEAEGLAVDLILVPEFVSGGRVRYVINTSDSLGELIDLRSTTGTFTGTIRPIVTYQGDQLIGPTTPIAIEIAPIKQVVYLDFRSSYVESLRMFGLRAIDQKIRSRVFEVVRAAYPAVNIEFRAEAPTDFALFSLVEIHGPDPNGMGLFGYDNSPGKDSGNERLYDRLGGVNAATQQDGFPGYGGVFIESLMAFSLHPASGVSLPGADPVFDQLFDPFRPDYGYPVVGADLTAGIPTISGDACPAADRRTRVACAVWSLGSLVGGTLAHEIGHSLGLANPGGEGFHNVGDEPNRLMESGGSRPFLERATVGGQGPSVFCASEYVYLREILPSSLPADPSRRPGC